MRIIQFTIREVERMIQLLQNLAISGEHYACPECRVCNACSGYVVPQHRDDCKLNRELQMLIARSKNQ